MMMDVPAPLIRVETFICLDKLVQPLGLPQQALTKLQMEEGPRMPFWSNLIQVE